jgi:hypothetical protein
VGQVRLLKAQSARRLTAPPAESEGTGAEINYLQNLFYKKIDYYWHIRIGFVYNEEYDSSRD